MNEWQSALRPDGQAFDEIRIVTEPRYKESEMSGDEWRISATVQMFRNGVLVHEESGWRNVETAAKYLSYLMDHARDEIGGQYAGAKGSCDQEGCSEKATVFYQAKKDFCCHCANEKEPFAKLFRKFCERHKRRGDCGLDDADDNYTLLDADPSLEEVK